MGTRDFALNFELAQGLASSFGTLLLLRARASALRAWGLKLRKCILIVDDNALMRKIVRALFEERSDCQVCGEAVNGQDAIEKAARLHPDLIVLDLAMPVMNGLEAAKVLHQTMPRVPLVMLTSHVNNLVEPEARKAGISAILSKDDSFEKLADMCLELVN